MKPKLYWTLDQYQALWVSLEHWYENWEDPDMATIGSQACKCCIQFHNSANDFTHQCADCPIYLTVGVDGCIDTPWEEIGDPNNKNSPQDQMLKEYQFLVDVIFQT